MVYNTSMVGLQTMSSFSPVALTVVVMIAIVLTIFIVSIRFRMFLIGAAATGIGYGIYCLARTIVTSKISGDGTIWNNWVWATIFVIVSIVVGAIMYSIPSVNQWMKGFDDKEVVAEVAIKKDKESKN
jgi:hypothetical protein